MKKKIQKPFSIEEWKKGAQVETRDGRQVELLKTDFKDTNSIVSMVSIVYNPDGTQLINLTDRSGLWDAESEREYSLDLVIVEEVEETYIDKVKRSAEAMVKIAELMESDKRYGGAITDKEWKEGVDKFCIERTEGDKICEHFSWFLAFHTEEQRCLFLKENKQLIKDYLMIE